LGGRLLGRMHLRDRSQSANRAQYRVDQSPRDSSEVSTVCRRKILKTRVAFDCTADQRWPTHSRLAETSCR
jgi:hypothetical protein